MAEPRLVSVVMTVRGEPVDRLQRALDAVHTQRYAGPVEVLVAAPAGEPLPSGVRHVDNPTGARSSGLNLAVAAATGAVIVRVDARSVLPPDYVARCVARLDADPSVGVVGGSQHATATTDDVAERGIARALRNPWATGGAAYRREDAQGDVDTVYLGVFRRSELLDVGGWDERLDANEDFDLCQRYRAAGFRVWLEARLPVAYEPRRALRDIAQQYFAFGQSKVRFWRLTKSRPSLRQALPLIGVPALIVAVVLRPVTLVAAALGLVVLDQVADPDERNLRVRQVSLLTYVPIIGGWVAGVYAEWVRRR